MLPPSDHIKVQTIVFDCIRLPLAAVWDNPVDLHSHERIQGLASPGGREVGATNHLRMKNNTNTQSARWLKPHPSMSSPKNWRESENLSEKPKPGKYGCFLSRSMSKFPLSHFTASLMIISSNGLLSIRNIHAISKVLTFSMLKESVRWVCVWGGCNYTGF